MAFSYHTHYKQPAGSATNWAVLVAGSNSWGNYRHQADISHSYQVMIEHGVPGSYLMLACCVLTNPDHQRKTSYS